MSSNSSSSTTSDSESDTGSLRLPSSLPLPGKRESNLEEWEIQAPKNEFVSDSKDAGKSLGQGRAAVQPRRYTCQDCGMVFANRTALDEHVVGFLSATWKISTNILSLSRILSIERISSCTSST